MKWTPGPWIADYFGFVYPAATAGTKELAILPGALNRTSMANAHLIAAAPDLYEALEILLNNFGHYWPTDYAAQARAALGKARGEACTQDSERVQDSLQSIENK